MIGAAIILIVGWGWHLAVAWRTFTVFLGFVLLFLLGLGNWLLCAFVHIDGSELKVGRGDEANIVDGALLVLGVHAFHLLIFLLHVLSLFTADHYTGAFWHVQLTSTVLAQLTGVVGTSC